MREQRPAPVRTGRRGPVRSLVTLDVVAGLVATVAIPAYAAWRPEAEATTLQQLAADDAQSLVVASDVADRPLGPRLVLRDHAGRDREEEGRRSCGRRGRSARRQPGRRVGTYAIPADVPLVSPGSGDVRCPLRTSTTSERPVRGPPAAPTLARARHPDLRRRRRRRPRLHESYGGLRRRHHDRPRHRRPARAVRLRPHDLRQPHRSAPARPSRPAS